MINMVLNERKEKGKTIALKSDLIRISDYHYRVHSQTTTRDYDVIKTDNFWYCSCPDHKFRKKCCKHIHAVEYSIRVREQVREQNKIVISPVSIADCKYCHSNKIVKDGIRHNKHVDIQKFYCKNCSRYFTINVGFEKMKHNPDGVIMAMQLYFSGESLRSVARSIRLQGVEVTHQTVYNWILKYTKLLKEYLNKIEPKVGDAWRADEVFVKIRGELRYVFSVMDDETRFWIAQEVADRKERHDARGLLQKAKQITGTKPKVFITDGLGSYHDAYMKEFWTVKRQNRTLHIKHIHLQGDMNNNKMERLNGEFRDREKVVRGIKKEDSVIIDGYQLYHNYIRPHMGLNGRTPAEVTGIKIDGDNKWKTLIQNASKKSN